MTTPSSSNRPSPRHIILICYKLSIVTIHVTLMNKYPARRVLHRVDSCKASPGCDAPVDHEESGLQKRQDKVKVYHEKLKISLIKCWKLTGALHSPKGITRY